MRNIQYFYSTTNNERGYIDFRNVYCYISTIEKTQKIPAIDGLSWDIDKNTYSIITGQQNSLYSAWRKANPLKQMDISEMADIELKAMKNAGIPEDVATGWVVKGLEDLQAKGVKSIANIPWNGVN